MPDLSLKKSSSTPSAFVYATRPDNRVVLPRASNTTEVPLEDEDEDEDDADADADANAEGGEVLPNAVAVPAVGRDLERGDLGLTVVSVSGPWPRGDVAFAFAFAFDFAFDLPVLVLCLVRRWVLVVVRGLGL